MNRDEFMALPPAIALGLLFDANPQLQSVEKPRVPYPPKFDGKQGKKGQYCWMSEMTLEGLRYWYDKNIKGAEGGQYAEKNRAAAKKLQYWVEWRTAFPTEQWRGKRGDEMVTANPPSRDPELYDWERNGDRPEPKRSSFDDQGDGDFGSSGGSFAPDDDDIPF